MYEEEDDDLPLQYRRLTQHLQTGSADFNKRLSAYLTQHVAMRSALEQGIAQSYAQQYPGGPQFQGQYSMYQSPMLAHHQQQPQQSMQQQMFNNNNDKRQQPYPSPQMNPRAMSHQRSASIATPQELTLQTKTSPVIPNNERRMSMPVNQASNLSSPNPANQQTMTPTSKASTPTSLSRPAVPSFPQGSFSNTNNFSLPQYHNGAFGNTDFMGFSTALPNNSQQLLAGGLDSNDPLGSMFMAGSGSVPQYVYNNNGQASAQSDLTLNKSSSGQLYPTFDGLNSTLSQATSLNPREMELFGSNAINQPSFFEQGMNDSAGGTGDNTPGAGEAWSLFMNDDSDKWDIPTASQ